MSSTNWWVYIEGDRAVAADRNPRSLRHPMVLVDAIETGRVPAGHVHELGLADLGGNRSRSPHFIGLGDTLATGKLLGLPMPREVRVFAIEVADTMTLDAGLSPAVAAALPAAVDHVVATARALARAVTSGA
ncbi:MAG: hydrogenase maturation protease [Opitutaceae bacterium]|nr:hydrogenase maturation protease [Opitutaceae bacterium]